MDFTIVKLSDYSNAFKLLHEYNYSIACTLDENELNVWIEKILSIGDPLAIIINNKIIAFLLLYCNHFDTLEAYICNVYVHESFRGNKLSQLLVENAIDICKSRNFKVINLDVADDNLPAKKIYTKCGFIETKQYLNGTKKYVRMSLMLKN